MIESRRRSPPDDYSDLHWLRGWGERLRSLIDDKDCAPSKHDWIIYLPDCLAKDAMMRFSVKYPYVIRQIADALDIAQACFKTFGDDDFATYADDGTYTESALDFSEAKRILCERIETGVSVIADGEEPAPSDMSIDRRWADELRSAVRNLDRARVEPGSENASHKDVTMVAATPPLCRQEQALKTIVEALARIKSTCWLRGKAGLLDLHRSLQRFFCQFLSVAYDLNLVELDNVQPNFPAIDIGDSEKRRCFQITTMKSKDKVQRTLVKYVEKKLHEQFGAITIVVLGERQREYKSLRVPAAIKFNSRKDILGLSELLKHVQTLETPTLERLVEVIGRELHLND